MTKQVKLVVAVFTNLLFVLGVVFVVVGLIQGIKIVGYKLLLDEYPTRYGGDDCTYVEAGYPIPVGLVPPKMASESADVEEQREACEERVERGRRTKQVDDVALVVGMGVSGLALVVMFNPKGKWAVNE